jgi:hypothetical protein
MPGPLRVANALFVGGVAAGLALALLADLFWRLAAWEAKLFRIQLEDLRRRAAEHAAMMAVSSDAGSRDEG